jgi:hypothetical protein
MHDRPQGHLGKGQIVPDLDRRLLARNDDIFHIHPQRGQNITFFPISIGEESDAGRPVGVVFNRDDPGGYTFFLPSEIDYSIEPLMAAPSGPDGDVAVVVATRLLGQRDDQRFFGSALRDLIKR